MFVPVDKQIALLHKQKQTKNTKHLTAILNTLVVEELGFAL